MIDWRGWEIQRRFGSMVVVEKSRAFGDDPCSSTTREVAMLDDWLDS